VVLSGVTALLCMRSREKTNTPAVDEAQAEVEMNSQAAPESIEHLAGVMEKEGGTSESSSSGKTSD